METLQKLVDRKGPGHLFRLAHFVLALKAIKEKGPIGRYELGRTLDLGGGSIRTLVNRLKDASIITVEGKKGHILAEKGKKVLGKIEKNLISFQNLVEAEELTNKKFNLGCQVRDVSTKIGSGINLRDAAISVGAKSITSLIYTGNNNLEIPTLGKDYLKNQHPTLLKYLLSNYAFQKDDVLVICGADSVIIAQLGAITAVLSLISV
ncbi:MAG: hypothetical protein HWN66_10055 [Candidatus Helarchaeota archaeon]|nr:hypothetical protein [Candidatus Helarchaeota archaeon]